MTPARSVAATWLGLATLGVMLGCTRSWQRPEAELDAGASADAGDDAGAAAGQDTGVPTDAGAPDAFVPVTDGGDLSDADAGCGELTCEPPPVRHTGFEGQRCSPEGALTCAGASTVRRLVCQDGALRYTEPCEQGSVCETAAHEVETGRCVALGRCDAFEPSSGVGCVGDVRVQCDADGQATGLAPCQEHAHCEGAGTCACDAGYRLGDFSKTCEPVSLSGVLSRGGGGVYCSGLGAPQLGDAAGFWVAVLYRMQDEVVATRAIASQHVAGAGWALIESAGGLRFELGTLREGDVPGVFASEAYAIPSEEHASLQMQLAVGVFDGSALQLHVGGRAVGEPVQARFSPADARLCVLGELGAGSVGDAPVASSITSVFGLAGGSPAPSADELAELFASTRREVMLVGIKGKTQFAFGFRPEGAGPPVSVSNTAGREFALDAIGAILLSEGPVRWAY